MRKIVMFLATAACMSAFPALGGPPASDRPIIVADELCVGPACVGSRHRDEPRYRDRDDCKEVTVHERHGDETVDHTVRKCDD